MLTRHDLRKEYVNEELETRREYAGRRRWIFEMTAKEDILTNGVGPTERSRWKT